VKEKNDMTKKRVIYICLAAAAVAAIVIVLLALMNSSNGKKYENYFNDGKQYYESGDYQSAIQYLEKAVSLKQTDESVLMLADCYVAEGQTDKAIALLEQYSDGSEAVKKRLSELRSGSAPGGDAVVAGETFAADTTSVGLSGKQLTSADIAPLAKLTSLQSATLSKNKITDISVLSGLKKLEVLDLSDNSITDISALSGLSSLRTLYLDNNKITDFKPLYGLSNLTTLSIKGMDITEKQLKEIQDALPDCRVHSEKASEDVEDITLGGVTFKSNVTSLDLSSKGITDISELSKCEDLEKLDLRWNNITDLTPLMDIPGLKWLCIKNNSVSDLRPLMGLTRLTYLDAQSNRISSISSVPSLGSLQYLYLGGNSIGSFAPLAECTNLLEVGLEKTGMKDSDLSSLSNHRTIVKLFLDNNPALTKGGVDALQKSLPNCKISASGLKNEITLGGKSFAADAESVNAENLGITDISAVANFTKCRTLLLRGNKISSLTPISKLTSVTTLDLSDNSITDVSPLSSMTGLRSLNLEGNAISDVSPLMSMTWLSELYISGSNLTQEQIEALYAALPGCSITVEGYTP
jgi:internalin A